MSSSAGASSSAMPRTGSSAASSSTSTSLKKQTNQRLLLHSLARYVNWMLDRVGGMKVLVLDQETTGMLSMVYSQSQILQKEVFLVEKIENLIVEGSSSGSGGGSSRLSLDGRDVVLPSASSAGHGGLASEDVRHLNAVFFIRPTDKNFMLLTKHLKESRKVYRALNLFFTNAVPHHRLEQLACVDEAEKVLQVQEVFADVYAVTDTLFSLNMMTNIWMSVRNPVHWTAYEESIFHRHVDGILSAAIALQSADGCRPIVRFSHGSVICQKLALEVANRIRDEGNLFAGGGSGEPRVVLIVDRRDDPVTPLLNQWTYHAMINELLPLENNRVDLREKSGGGAGMGNKDNSQNQQLVISTLYDPFFEDNMFSNFGDLGANIKQYVAQFQQETKNNAKIDTIQDMQNFVDKYPEFRHLSGNVSKHVAVVYELSRIVQNCGLLDVSQIEQDLACSESRTQHFDAVMGKLRQVDMNNMERLRLVLLFALRYEDARPQIEQLKTELARNQIDPEQIQLVDCLLKYAGASVRSGDLFQNKTWLNAGMNRLAKTLQPFKGIENVYTQHTSVLKQTVTNLVQNKLRESEFPYAPGSGGGGGAGISSVLQDESSNRRLNVLVFVVGGATFEEHRDVMDVANQQGARIVLGGSCLHSSKTFLADVAQLARAKY